MIQSAALIFPSTFLATYGWAVSLGHADKIWPYISDTGDDDDGDDDDDDDGDDGDDDDDGDYGDDYHRHHQPQHQHQLPHQVWSHKGSFIIIC